jgi:hypothetical protein
MVRRTIAAGAGVLVVILLVVGLRACLNARNERAIKDYVRDVNALVGESNQQSDQLFKALEQSPNAGDVDRINQLNAFRSQAAQFVDRARALDAPGDMSSAKGFLVETMRFRAAGVSDIADAIDQSGDAKPSSKAIAQDMQDFLTSDVIYQERAVQAMRDTLKDKGLGETITASVYLPTVDWLQVDYVGERVGSGGGGSDGQASPGLHGNGLGTVTLGGQTLAPEESTSVTLSDDLSFEVQVVNQGENDESDVKVVVTVGKGGDAVKLEKTLDAIAAGETKSVQLPLREKPATGQNVPVTVEIEAVPGEEKTDNNKGDFTVIFTS